MTRYALDVDRGLLLSSWSTGSGDTARIVANIPSAADRVTALHLAHELSSLSKALWRCYTHPASAEPSMEPNTTGWRCQRNREAFTEVLPALTDPNLPHNGAMMVSYNPVVEGAHRVGRALHDIGDEELANLVVAEAKAELEAVEQAELGDLSGRARQAVVLTRADASPVQVSAADRLLGSDALMTDVDPTAAAVAAVHWLAAAADVAAEESGLAPERIVVEADDIEALPHWTPTLVLETIAGGEQPHDVVTRLIRDAMTVAEGNLPDVALLDTLKDRAKRFLPDIDLEDPVAREQLHGSLRLTPLDPARPALDMLEDLLSGIHGCWLIFHEYAEPPGSGETGDDGDRDEDAEDEHDDAYYEARNEAMMAEFIEAVRAAAAEDHDRLL